MQILVTGGAGYIGSHTAKALAQSGVTPVTLNNLSTGHAESVQWGPLIVGDVGDRGLVRRVLDEYPIDGIIHFAASAYVGESVANPRKYFANNVMNSLALVETALDSGVDRIVFSSSCATYGVPDALPVHEDSPQQPVNPYGESKRFNERMLHAYGNAYGLRSVVLRYFNAAGADSDGEIGEWHDPETHLVPLAIQAALGERPALHVYGSDYQTPDGTAIRDFVHVGDLADAHVRAIVYLASGGASTALNLGNGRGFTVREVIRTVEEVSGCPVPVVAGDRRPGDPPALVADATQARGILGWRPSHPHLADIIDSAWAWHTRHEPRVEAARFAIAAVAHD